MNNKTIQTALISVYHKDNIDELLTVLKRYSVKIISTGGTYDYIKSKGLEVTSVEELTGYPSVFGGRVKTLHPKIMGGILYRRENASDNKEKAQYDIPSVDMVVVDLYPFEETLKTTNNADEIIEKIDIGGISLIRAAAKNFNDVLVVPSAAYYKEAMEMLAQQNCTTTFEQRRRFAGYAFCVSSHYDTAIFSYFADSTEKIACKVSAMNAVPLRYGENPHQTAEFYGNLDEVFTKLQGKEISYNNLLDIEAAISLIRDFKEPTFAILKHNNACGLASRSNLTEAWKAALAGDPVSAFGGIIITNNPVDSETAEEINKLFFEVILAPDYSEQALEVLSGKKNRIILKLNKYPENKDTIRTLLNGIIRQDRDSVVETRENLRTVTLRPPTDKEIDDLLFANIIVKHTKSNAIVLAKDRQLIGSGTGQTSRVDALKQAIEKARSFGFDLKGAVMASDAFFPFDDCVRIADEAGITAVIQPGGSVRDTDSVDYCNKAGMAMVMTGIRHFKH